MVEAVADRGAKDKLFGLEPYKETKNEEYMGEAQLAHFREILVRWKQALEEDITKTYALIQDQNVNLPDPNDRASVETDMSLELRSRDRERKLVKKIDSSIRAIDNDDYGYCERCGEEIGIKRLEARPTATLCFDCKTLEEIKEKQMM